MAQQPILSALYDVGRAIRRELFRKIVENQEDINSRTVILEQGAAKVNIWNDRVILGSQSASLTGVDLWQAPAAFTLLEAKLGIFLEAGITGILEMDIQKSPDLDPANFNTVFTTKPSIDFDDVGTTDYFESTNAVFDINEILVDAGDWLRLDFSSLPTPLAGFTTRLTGEFN